MSGKPHRVPVPQTSSSPLQATKSLPANEAAFLPRSEFWKSELVSHEFALVSFNGNEILRLANCPDDLVAAVRKALPPDDVRHFREDKDIVVCEFLLAGKPFSGRSTKQERLLLNIFTAIISEGYRPITSIDYGRIYLDKLTLAFRRPLTTPPVPSGSIPPPPGFQSRRDAFGLSFVSSTALRVVKPPLALTPAILQVVRSAWPLGVVNEKRESDGSFLFKLKGYSFFKQSTFETDSLAHTLELLRGMDSHGFTLLTTVCLGKRSRVQDFWIFSAPAPPQPPTSPSIGLPLAAMPSIRKVKDGDVQGSPVQSHSMLGLGNADVPSAIKRGAQPPMPSPAVNPAVQAAIASSSGHTRSASNPTAGPRSSHIRTSSLPGAQHVLRKTPPPGASKERIPPLDSTPRASPRERARNLQPSPLPGQRGPSPSPPQQNIPQAYPVMPTSSVASSNQFIYMASPPPSGPEPIYNTVPSGTFALPPQAGGIERVGPSGHSRSATQGTHDPRQDEYDRLAEDGEEDEDEEEEHEQEDEYHETPPLLGAGVFRDTVGTSVNFGDTLTQYSEDESFSDEGRTREGDLERAAAAAAYLGAVGVADFSGANENDARRDVARPRDSLASEESRATIVYQKDADAQGATPRLVRADLLPDSDPARRASNSLSISYAGSHSVAPSSFSPSQTGVPPFLDPGNRTVSDATTHYLPGAWVTDPNTPTEFDNQRHDYGPPEDLRTPGDEASEIGLDVSDLAPSAATTPGVELDRLTTRAAAAEVVSWSNSAQRHQQQVGMGMDDGNGIGPSLSRANSGLSDVTMDSMASTADGNTALHEPQLVVRVSDESSRDGPWALVNDHANTTSIVEVEPPVPSNPPNTEASPPPAPSVASPLPATTTPAAPAAVPTPIPAIGDQSAFVKTKKGAFPWSKSRREAREREKALEREKFRAKVDEARKKSTSTAPAAGTSSSGVPAPAITSNVNTSPVEVKNSSLTPVQPEGPSNTSSMVVETGTSTSSSSSSSASTDSSSSSTLPTPTHNSPDVPAVATVSHGREASDGSSPARLRTARKPSGIPEVTVADRRLTID